MTEGSYRMRGGGRREVLRDMVGAAGVVAGATRTTARGRLRRQEGQGRQGARGRLRTSALGQYKQYMDGTKKSVTPVAH